MRNPIRLLCLLLSAATLAGCASAPPPVGSLGTDQPREAVQRVVHERSNQVFVIQHDAATYRFEREIFTRRRSGQLDTFWFVYRDDRLYTVVTPKDFGTPTDAPPCSEADQRRWWALAESARSRDLAGFDFGDPTLLPPEDPQRAHPLLVVALVGGSFIYVPPLMDVSVAFALGATLPDAFSDLPARRYADAPGFGISKRDLEAKIGKSWRGPALSGRCEYDFYGGRVFGSYWVQYVYLDGRLFAMEREGY